MNYMNMNNANMNNANMNNANMNNANMNNANMNYIIEDNLDFKSALFDDNDLDTDSNICLISQQKLTRSHISLPCEHKFNYMPLYNEIYKQKQKNLFEVCNLGVNQIKCPYCRTVFDKLLPYIPSECVLKSNGVNYPFKYCMENTIKCQWQKIKNTCIIKCNKVAQYMGANEMGANDYCKTHYLKVLNKETHAKETHAKENHAKETHAKETHAKKNHAKQNIAMQIEWTDEMSIMLKSKTVVELKQLLRSHKLKVAGTKKTLVERIFENNLSNN